MNNAMKNEDVPLMVIECNRDNYEKKLSRKHVENIKTSLSLLYYTYWSWDGWVIEYDNYDAYFFRTITDGFTGAGNRIYKNIVT